MDTRLSYSSRTGGIKQVIKMLSQKSKYAIRAVLYISAQMESSEKQYLGGKEISEKLNMPLAFTVKILQELARESIISSSKGPGGGFYLTSDNQKTPIMEILKTMGDTGNFTNCMLGLEKCSDSNPCPVHHSFKIGRNHLLDLLQNKTIGELGEETRLGKHHLV